MTRFDELRRQMEELSGAILTLINRRAECALEIEREKRRLGLPIRDRFRELQLLDRIAAQNAGPLDDAAVRATFRTLIDQCVALMEERRAKEERTNEIERRVQLR